MHSIQNVEDLQSEKTKVSTVKWQLLRRLLFNLQLAGSQCQRKTITIT